MAAREHGHSVKDERATRGQGLKVARRTREDLVGASLGGVAATCVKIPRTPVKLL
jgi:hypothetical protein